MWNRFQDRQKLAIGALGFFGVFIIGWLGSSCLRSPSPLNIVPMGIGSPAQGKPVKVHVTGCVKKPGVVDLTTESRVQDAIASAGGASEDADVSSLNLAARVIDGEKIHVPRKGEVVVAPATATGRNVQGSKATLNGQVSLNSAGLNELDQLPGVGPATAQKIIEYRNSHGGFRTLDELMAVQGIGRKKFDKMLPFLKL